MSPSSARLAVAIASGDRSIWNQCFRWPGTPIARQSCPARHRHEICRCCRAERTRMEPKSHALTQSHARAGRAGYPRKCASTNRTAQFRIRSDQDADIRASVVDSTKRLAIVGEGDTPARASCHRNRRLQPCGTVPLRGDIPTHGSTLHCAAKDSPVSGERRRKRPIPEDRMGSRSLGPGICAQTETVIARQRCGPFDHPPLNADRSVPVRK